MFNARSIFPGYYPCLPMCQQDVLYVLVSGRENVNTTLLSCFGAILKSTMVFINSLFTAVFHIQEAAIQYQWSCPYIIADPLCRSVAVMMHPPIKPLPEKIWNMDGPHSWCPVSDSYWSWYRTPLQLSMLEFCLYQWHAALMPVNWSLFWVCFCFWIHWYFDTVGSTAVTISDVYKNSAVPVPLWDGVCEKRGLSNDNWLCVRALGLRETVHPVESLTAAHENPHRRQAIHMPTFWLFQGILAAL